MPIVSPQIRVRHPAHFLIGEDSIVDDFCYFSTRVQVGRACHIGSSCSVAGGVAHLFTLGDYSSVGSGVRIWCTSDDFVNDLVTIIPAAAGPIKAHLIEGDVTFGCFTAVGSNSVVMPGNTIPDGTVVGALSYVPARFRFEPWAVYAGMPVRLIGRRNKDSVMAQVQALDDALHVQGGHRG